MHSVGQGAEIWQNHKTPAVGKPIPVVLAHASLSTSGSSGQSTCTLITFQQTCVLLALRACVPTLRLLQRCILACVCTSLRPSSGVHPKRGARVTPQLFASRKSGQICLTFCEPAVDPYTWTLPWLWKRKLKRNAAGRPETIFYSTVRSRRSKAA